MAKDILTEAEDFVNRIDSRVNKQPSLFEGKHGLP